MAHSLIVGMTESGKTTLAKRLSHSLHAQGKNVIVLDPLNDPEWGGGFRTSDPNQFLECYWANKQLYAFIDESGDVVGQYDVLMQKTATRGRHWGHSNFYLTQRGAMLSPTVRGQCRHLFMFTSPLDDCKLYAKEFNKPELIQGANLPQGHYFHVARFGALERGQLW